MASRAFRRRRVRYRSYREPAVADQTKPLYPHQIRGDPEFWAKFKIYPRHPGPSARSDGHIRAKYRVYPRKIQPEEREVFLQWMQDHPFKGNNTRVLTGPTEGTFCFMQQEDAAIFKMFWG